MRDLSPSDLAQLTDFVAGETPALERPLVEQWVAADPELLAFVRQLDQARRGKNSAVARLHGVRGEVPSLYDRDALAPHVELIANALTREMARSTPQSSVWTSSEKPVDASNRRARIANAKIPSILSRSGQRSWRGAAMFAAMTVAVAAVGLWTHMHRSPTPTGFTGKQVVMQEYVTPKGRRATVTLADGSAVILNVDSRLRVPQDFDRGSRDVYLEGEAQFTVTHHEARPFTVHTGGIVVRELGTVFGVRAYANEGRTQVIVAQGRVSVSTSAVAIPNTAVLSRGELATVTYDGTTYVDRNAAINQYLDWTAGRLVFRDAPISEVLTQLSRWYDLDFRVTDSALAARRVNLFIPDQIWRPGMLEILEQALEVRIRHDGRVVTFSPLSLTE